MVARLAAVVLDCANGLAAAVLEPLEPLVTTVGRFGLAVMLFTTLPVRVIGPLYSV